MAREVNTPQVERAKASKDRDSAAALDRVVRKAAVKVVKKEIDDFLKEMRGGEVHLAFLF